MDMKRVPNKDCLCASLKTTVCLYRRIIYFVTILLKIFILFIFYKTKNLTKRMAIPDHLNSIRVCLSPDLLENKGYML